MSERIDKAFAAVRDIATPPLAEVGFAEILAEDLNLSAIVIYAYEKLAIQFEVGFHDDQVFMDFAKVPYSGIETSISGGISLLDLIKNAELPGYKQDYKCVNHAVNVWKDEKLRSALVERLPILLRYIPEAQRRLLRSK